jgi:tRNA(Leu) C34 or U34 (ribose-2'-O)-methylase TrmL
MISCLDNLYKEYDPIILCTDISSESINILEINSFIHNKIKYFNSEESELSKKILNTLFFHHLMKKEQIEEYKKIFHNDEIFMKKEGEENQEFIKKLYLGGKFLHELTKEIQNQKPKILVIVFGNESRGVSNYIKSKCHHKIIIPHFGYPDTSYNLSVSCGIILFHLYSQKILPGSFTDFSSEKGIEILAKNVLNSFQALPRSEIIKHGLEKELDDF